MELHSLTSARLAPQISAIKAPSTPPDHVKLGTSNPLLGLMPRPLARVIAGYDRGYLDLSVPPQQDFYAFALGGYESTHPIPADKATFGVRTELNDRIQKELLELCQQAVTAPVGSNDRKLGDFYASGMDEAAIEAAATRPLQSLFERLNSVTTRQGLQEALGWLHHQGVGALFSYGSSQDRHDPSRNIAQVFQGGLSLPSRDYYVDESKGELRAKFQEHLGKMLELAGEPDAAGQAATIVKIETRLAQGQLTKVELRDPHKTDNLSDLKGLSALCPGLDWAAYAASQGTPEPGKLNIGTPAFFENLNKVWGEFSVDEWKSYLKWHTLDATSGLLPDRFGAQQFEFNGKILNGIPARLPRDQRMVRLVDGYLGEVLGQKFVAKNFSPEAKERARSMVLTIRDVLRDRIATGWMSPETKQEALAKIDTLKVKIGYPDEWRDYSQLEVRPDSLFDNVMRARRFNREEELAEIGKPADPNHWGMTPQTVNAYYQPLNNEICFPAARLQPPFFDVKQDDAYNLGATGATIGHEMSHGFDDKGCRYDSRGFLRNWWSDADRQRFEQIANGIVTQMNEFSFDGQQNNGKLVQGEAIADQGGLELAYEALRRGGPAPASGDGFTAEQRFFLAYALCRQGSTRPEAAHGQMSNDSHPLGPFRVNGPLANMPAFHQAFGAQPGDPMVRPEAQRNKLWDP